MSFERFSFDRRIAAGVKFVGYTVPTPIQAKAIPVVLRGGDMLGLAQTGTGKTAAFVLPILQRLSVGPRGKIRALIVAPTRELAEQIHEEIVKLGRETKIRSATIYGGVSKGPQLQALRRGVEIVVACPGRLLDHVDAGALDLSNVEVLVLDEADRMCDMGFLPDIKRIIRQVPEKRQTLFFSATMPEDIRMLADKILNKPEMVQIGISAPAETVSHALYPVPEDRRKELLAAMLKGTSTGRVLVFTRTKHRARSLAIYMEKQGHRATALQGNMTQSQRQQAINGFRKGKYDVLIATDIAARGIDVSQISHVVNFDMPDTVDAYTHRIGRTGRAERSGEAFTFAIRGDGLMVKQIEKTLGTKLERRRLPEFEYGSGFDPERQFLQTSSSTSFSRLPKSFSSRGGGSRRRSR
ncbi:DEAD/DEAH box helicase [Candidatus Bipolaricaulota bacterium]|nr:DEAD/DEAH box helicase [Candidatus Bipolaricaulota bacterium]